MCNLWITASGADREQARAEAVDLGGQHAVAADAARVEWTCRIPVRAVSPDEGKTKFPSVQATSVRGPGG